MFGTRERRYQEPAICNDEKTSLEKKSNLAKFKTPNGNSSNNAHEITDSYRGIRPAF